MFSQEAQKDGAHSDAFCIKFNFVFGLQIHLQATFASVDD